MESKCDGRADNHSDAQPLQPIHHFIEDKVVSQACVHDAYVAEHRHHARLFILTRDSLADERCHIKARRDHNPANLLARILKNSRQLAVHSSGNDVDDYDRDQGNERIVEKDDAPVDFLHHTRLHGNHALANRVVEDERAAYKAYHSRRLPCLQFQRSLLFTDFFVQDDVRACDEYDAGEADEHRHLGEASDRLPNQAKGKNGGPEGRCRNNRLLVD